jgi:hypothetical protein
MTIAEILKGITVDDEFFDKLRCQNELIAGMSVDKPNAYIISCLGQLDDVYKVRLLF